ncbi:MAG: STAS domain-containing protein [Bacteroidales bacterium]|nr:STAS domain-containing protein [Bacteroidales bacterium]
MSDFKLIQNSDKKNKISNIEIQGNLTIKNSDSLKKKLIESEEKYNELNITLKDIEKIDVSAIQLFYSLKKNCNEKNKKIIFNTHFSDEISELLKHSGLDKIFINNN